MTLTATLSMVLAATSGAQIKYGPSVPFGGDVARTWVQVDAKGVPMTLGIAITEKAVDGLPKEKPPVGEVYESILHLPKEAKSTAFDHVGLDWAPQGHTPIQIYGVPHFDFHFYAVPRAELEKITAQGDDLKRCQVKPDAKFVPEGYFLAPESEIPRMGAHWVDLKSPELNGGKFTSTLIYGSYNGKVTFIEPMVAMSFLKSKPNFTAPIKQPAASPWKGKYVPTEYSIRFDASTKTYQIELAKFVKGK